MDNKNRYFNYYLDSVYASDNSFIDNSNEVEIISNETLIEKHYHK